MAYSGMNAHHNKSAVRRERQKAHGAFPHAG
jgi:hypothetical protein